MRKLITLMLLVVAGCSPFQVLQGTLDSTHKQPTTAPTYYSDNDPERPLDGLTMRDLKRGRRR